MFSLLYLSQDIGFAHYRSILDNFKIVVVVPKNTDELGIKLLEEKIYTSNYVRGVNYVSSDQAWRNLKSDSFIDKNFQKYSDNSLPHTFVIKMEYVKSGEIAGFIETLKDMGGVKDVLFDRMTLRWIGLFQRYLNFSYLVFLVVSGVMVLLALILSVLYFLQKDYKHYLNLVLLEFISGFSGAVISFFVCFFVLMNIGPDNSLFRISEFGHLLFAFLSAVFTSGILSLFVVIASREARKVS